MAAKKTESTSLKIEPRDASNSRATRRLRRDGRVPGVLYGLGDDCLSFWVDARELRCTAGRLVYLGRAERGSGNIDVRPGSDG